jgi:hypothetical protein
VSEGRWETWEAKETRGTKERRAVRETRVRWEIQELEDQWAPLDQQDGQDHKVNK